jgi:hypothetical protein
LAIISVAIGGFFSVLFHVFVVERTDEEIKRATILMEIEEINAPPPTTSGHHNDFVESLNTVTNVRSVASSMAISKVHAQQRRRRSSSRSSGRSRNSADKEAGQSLLSDQDDIPHSPSSSLDAITPITQPNQPQEPISIAGSRMNLHQDYSTKSLNRGKETVTVCDWLSMPQFYIVGVMYMSTRLSINITQAYMPLYVQETLKLECGSVATVPLTMFCSGFVISIFIKLINKYFGRQLAYTFGASLCITGALLILLLDWTPGSVLATKGIYGVAVLLGTLNYSNLFH